MSWMLKKLAGWGLGVTGLSSPFLLLVVATGLAMAAAAAWMRDEALDKCNASWQIELALKNNEILALTRERDQMIAVKDREIAARMAAAESKAHEEAALLKEQANEFPLSLDCAKCRVPNERIWVRKSAAAPTASSNRSKAAPGS